MSKFQKSEDRSRRDRRFPDIPVPISVSCGEKKIYEKRRKESRRRDEKERTKDLEDLSIENERK